MSLNITLVPVRLISYTNGRAGRSTLSTYYINANVAQSFIDAIHDWQAQGNKFWVTEIYRDFKTQAAAHINKPTLAKPAGRSLHGKGQAFDFDIRAIGANNLVKFYTHMEKYGWYTKFNFPGQPIGTAKTATDEPYHMQNTYDPELGTQPGMFSPDYFDLWASQNGGEANLTKLTYTYDKSGNIPQYAAIAPAGKSNLAAAVLIGIIALIGYRLYTKGGIVL